MRHPASRQPHQTPIESYWCAPRRLCERSQLRRRSCALSRCPLTTVVAAFVNPRSDQLPARRDQQTLCPSYTSTSAARQVSARSDACAQHLRCTGERADLRSQGIQFCILRLHADIQLLSLRDLCVEAVEIRHAGGSEMRHDVLAPALLQCPSLFLSFASAAADAHRRDVGDIDSTSALASISSGCAVEVDSTGAPSFRIRRSRRSSRAHRHNEADVKRTSRSSQFVGQPPHWNRAH